MTELCGGCRDSVDCHCTGACKDLTSCIHGCHLSKNTNPHQGYTVVGPPPTLRSELEALLARYVDTSEKATIRSPHEDHFRGEHVSYVDKEILSSLLEIVSGDFKPDLQFVASHCHSYGDGGDLGEMYLGHNQTEDGARRWLELRIVFNIAGRSE